MLETHRTDRSDDATATPPFPYRRNDTHRCRIASHRLRTVTLAALATWTLGTRDAGAHFRLLAPTNWMTMSADGSPQKTGPCGNEAPQTPTNMTTAFRPGDTVTIQLEETVFHPGHYRVALAVNSQSELPPEPTVTPGATACGSVPIQQNPAFPVLADGMLVHTAALSGTQSFQVQLPTNVTCTSCTLQIIEFMSSHPAPCFYHHCANISIQAAAADAGAGTRDGGSDAGGGAGSGPGGAGGAGGSQGGAGGVGATGGSGPGGAGGLAGAGGSTAAGGASGGDGQAQGGCACSLAHPGRDARFGALGALVAALALSRRRRR